MLIYNRKRGKKGYKTNFKEKWGNRGYMGIQGLLLHLSINFNPKVSFESVVYRWKALSGLFLMDFLGR